MRLRLTLIVIIGLVLITNSTYTQSLKWMGKIEYEDGVKIVINPKEPLYGEIQFDLEEDLSIGNEGDENYMFYKARHVEVDKSGNIYVLDFGNHRLQKFDANGTYVLTIGIKGQGPGEFIAPVNMKIDDRNGEIFVNDNLRVVKRFNSAGEYLDRDIHVVELLSDLFIAQDNRIWTRLSNPRYRYLRRLNFDGVVENRIAEIPFKGHQKIVSKSRVGTRTSVLGYYFLHGYEYDLFIAQIDSRTFVYGHSKVYELIIMDLETNILRRVMKDERPRKFAYGEKDRIKFRIQGSAASQGRPIGDIELEFPEHKPFFYEIITDDKGRIYARKAPAKGEDYECYVYDVFSSQGYNLYSLSVAYQPLVIKAGLLYTKTEDNETGVEVIKRFKIANWDQINTGIN